MLCFGTGTATTTLEPIIEFKVFPELVNSVKKASVPPPPQQSPDANTNSEHNSNKAELLLALPLLFSVLMSLKPETFTATASQLIPSLFAISDRAVRATLLNSLPQIVPLLTTRLDSQASKFVNSKIFEVSETRTERIRTFGPHSFFCSAFALACI